LSRFRIKKELKNFLREEVGIENIYIDPFPDFLVQEGREKEREGRRAKNLSLQGGKRVVVEGMECAQTYIHIII